MPTIQETIRKAVMAKGPIILKSKVDLCIAIDDLSPNLSEEKSFIEKIYNDEIGGFLYEALIEGDIEKKKALLKEVDRYLDEENGRNPMWREKILSYFRDLFNVHVSKKNVNQKNNIMTSIEQFSENTGNDDGFIGEQDDRKDETMYAMLHPIKIHGKYGFANEKNEIVISPEYESVKPFSCDRAKVRRQGKYGFIDRSGRIVIRIIYERASDFRNNVSSVMLNGKEYNIDTEGNNI